MIHNLLRIFETVAILGCVSSCSYYLICLGSARSFLREKEGDEGADLAQAVPPVSILKPLKGADPEIYECFRSHCLQDYAEYEIIFGVSDPADPAVSFVRQLQQEFPDRAIHLIVCDKTLGANVKVSNLIQMLPHARHEYLIVNDSDIQVEREYLRRVMAPFAGPRVGMVTCLYRGVGASTLGSRLESLGIATDFCAGVLVARRLEGSLRFGLGSTLAFRRTDLELAGGFQAIVNFLADDYELGKRIAQLGLRVVLSDLVVETHLPPYGVRDFLAHQLRWARGVRDARPGGYIGLVSTFGLMWSLLTVIAARAAPWSWAALAFVLALRFAMALVVGRAVLRDRQLLPNLWLLPVRDLIAAFVWIASFAGRKVTWRGERFTLKRGQLIRMP